MHSKTGRPLGHIMERIAALIAGILMFMLVLITFMDVIGRQLGYPLAFAFEFTQVTVGVMFYVALPLVTLRREHITVDLIAIKPGSRRAFAVDALVNILCAGLVVVAAVELWHQGESLQMFNTVMMFTRWPIAPFVYFMSLLTVLTSLVFVALAISDARSALRPEKE